MEEKEIKVKIRKKIKDQEFKR